MGEKYPHEITAAHIWRDMCPNQSCQPLRRAARPLGDRLRGFHVASHSSFADLLQRRLLGGQVVVETRLPHAEDVGDPLGGRAVVAEFSEHAGGRFDDLA